MSQRSGIATHAVVGLLAMVAGALGMWAVRSRPHLDRVTTHGEWVYLPRGTDSLRAYVAYPERKDRAPAVIVIHEVFGLTNWEPTVGDKLAMNGFVAIVPDLLSSRWHTSPATPDSGRKLVAQLAPDAITSDLDAAYGYLNSLSAVDKDHIGVMGFCWGGGQSFRYATNNPKLRAAVVCYGVAPDSSSLTKINAPVLGVYGENDARVNGQLAGVSETMKRLGRSFVADSYPGTGHGFLKPGRQGSEGPEVDRAWTRILGFFHEKLK